MAIDFLQNKIIREDMDVIFNSGDYKKLKNKTVLVTGAYGMLASYMMYFMIYLNKIHFYDIMIISLSRNAEKFNTRFGYYARDITQINKSVNEKVDINCDYIIHAASFASPQYYTISPIDVILPNVLGTYNLLELAYEKNAHLLYFSTCSVYGHYEGERKLITEEDYGVIDPLDPHSCYDESKRAGEMLCVAYYRQKKVPVVIARIAHTYGPTMDIENDPRVFASFIKNVVNKEDISIKSDGSAKRSFCYISDATTAYFKLLLDGEPGEAYNVSNEGQTISIKELGEIVSNLANVGFSYVKRDDDEVYLQDKNADTATYSNAKIRKLGMLFNIDVKQGFTRVINYFLHINMGK